MVLFPRCNPVNPRPQPVPRQRSRRDRLSPLIGGVLIGTAIPAFGAQQAGREDPPLPRLRLSIVLASIAPASGSTGRAAPPPAGELHGQTPADASDGPALALSHDLILRNIASSVAQGTPASASSGRGKPPSPDDERRGRDLPITPPRQAPLEKTRPDTLADATKDGKLGPSRVTDQTPATTSDSNSAREGRGSADAKVVGGDEFLPADEIDDEPALPRATPDASAGSKTNTATTSTARKRGWGLAPIRWGGSLSAGFRHSRSEGSSGTAAQVYEGRLRVNSYIWQPYIALVSGDFGLTTTRTRDTGGDGSAASNNLSGTSINGNGTLSVFPQSRFPFTAALSLSDSRSQGSFTDSNTEYRRLSLRQNYKPPVGPWSATGAYDRSEIIGDFGTDIVDRLSGTYTTSLDRHSLSASGDISNSRSSDLSVGSYYASVSHGFRYDDELGFNTTGTYTNQRIDSSAQGEGRSFGGNVSSAQVFSFANWTPYESKWRGSATLRYFQTSSAFSGSSFDSQNLSGSASLTWQASRNLSMFGSLSASVSENNRTSTGQSLGASYSGDPLSLGEFSYNWSTSLNANNSTSSNGESSRTFGASLGHSVTRTWQLSSYSNLNASVNQTVTHSQSSGFGATSARSLSHSASLSLQASAADSLSGYLSASVSDSRTTGQFNSTFQMANVQLSGNWRINAYSEMNSNLTWQTNRQESDREDTVLITDEFGRPLLIKSSPRSQNSSLSGGLGYSNMRVFGVRSLRYRLDFRADTNRDNSRRFGNPDAEREPDHATLDLDQRLMYRIGRLDTELQFRVAEIQERRNQLIFFRVTREFGAF